MEVLIVYESNRGRIGSTAAKLAEAAEEFGATTTTRLADQATPDDVERADALIAGCWVKGNVPFGGREAAHMGNWIERLPYLDGTPAGAFCTYSFFPRTFPDVVARTAETLDLMSSGLEARGARVVATQSIHRRSRGKGIEPLVRAVLGSDAASPTS